MEKYQIGEGDWGDLDQSIENDFFMDLRGGVSFHPYFFNRKRQEKVKKGNGGGGHSGPI